MNYLAYIGGLASALAILAFALGIVRFLIQRHTQKHSLPVSRAKADAINLADFLSDQGKTLSWHSVETVSLKIQHRGFEKIKWPDQSGKVWRVVNHPGGDYPLASSIHIDQNGNK